jgi:hypothetical protein
LARFGIKGRTNSKTSHCSSSSSVPKLGWFHLVVIVQQQRKDGESVHWWWTREKEKWVFELCKQVFFQIGEISFFFYFLFCLVFWGH